jgi:hypothetical protein
MIFSRATLQKLLNANVLIFWCILTVLVHYLLCVVPSVLLYEEESPVPGLRGSP